MVFLVNHVSFFDTPLIVTSVPLSHIGLLRVLYANKLDKMPGLKQIFRACGHIPVGFKSDAPEELRVAEDSKAATAAGMERVLERRRILALLGRTPMGRRRTFKR